MALRESLWLLESAHSTINFKMDRTLCTTVGLEPRARAAKTLLSAWEAHAQCLNSRRCPGRSADGRHSGTMQRSSLLYIDGYISVAVIKHHNQGN